jgi:hypothetical protein
MATKNEDQTKYSLGNELENVKKNPLYNLTQQIKID